MTCVTLCVTISYVPFPFLFYFIWLWAALYMGF